MSATFKLVYIEWEDSLGCTAGWSHLDEAAEAPDVEPLIVRSVGWVHRENGTAIVLVPHLIEETERTSLQGMGYVTIPKSAIRRMSVMRIFRDDKLDAAARRVMRRKPAKTLKFPPGGSPP